MFRAFFKLWIVVFVPLFLLIFPNKYSPVNMLNTYAESTRYKQIYAGTFYLLQEQLKNLDRKARERKIVKLADDFGYELKLANLTELPYSQNIYNKIRSGEIVFINSEPELLLYRIPQSDQIISLALDVSQEEEIFRSSKGPLLLIAEDFNKTNKASWPELIDIYRKKFNYSLTISQPNSLHFTKEEYQILQKQKITWRQSSSGFLTFYILLSGSSLVLVAESIPFSSTNSFLIALILITFIAVISIGMYMWVYPLWRDLEDLSNTASSFGKGELDLRAKLSKNSVISRLAISFNNMAQQIQKLIKRHRDLTNTISHDLRTPLYRLRFAFEMLEDSDLSDEERVKYNRKISSSFDDLDHLINQTLIFSRYSSKSDPIFFTETELTKTIRKEIEFLEDEQEDLNIALMVQPDIEEMKIRVDNKAFIRMLNNLLANACRYARTQIVISLSFDESSNNFNLIVEDDGPGIDEEYWQQIFQPFAQLENKQRNSKEGYGLGLAIVKQIAQWHGGGCELSKSKFGGAKFSVHWPREIKLDSPSINLNK